MSAQQTTHNNFKTVKEVLSDKNFIATLKYPLENDIEEYLKAVNVKRGDLDISDEKMLKLADSNVKLFEFYKDTLSDKEKQIQVGTRMACDRKVLIITDKPLSEIEEELRDEGFEFDGNTKDGIFKYRNLRSTTPISVFSIPHHESSNLGKKSVSVADITNSYIHENNITDVVGIEKEKSANLDESNIDFKKAIEPLGLNTSDEAKLIPPEKKEPQKEQTTVKSLLKETQDFIAKTIDDKITAVKECKAKIADAISGLRLKEWGRDVSSRLGDFFKNKERKYYAPESRLEESKSSTQQNDTSPNNSLPSKNQPNSNTPRI